MTKYEGSNSRLVISGRWEWGTLIFILLVAAFFRLYRLDSVPPGLTHDEADTGHFAVSVYRGTPSRVEAPYGYANEPFTMYSGALFMALFGPTPVALRLHSVAFGMILLIFAYLWTRRVFGVATALGSAAMIAVSFWAVSNSRFALNSEPAAALFTGAVYFLWRAMGEEGENRPWWAWGLFALLLAGSLYAYEAARAAAGAFGLLFVYVAAVDRRRFRRHGLWFAGALAVAGLVAAPHLLDPAAWQRSSTLSEPLQAAVQGEWMPLLANTLSALGTFTFSGDSFITYNLPGRPIFDPIASLFFCGGIVLCIWRWRRPAYAFTLMWVMAGILPSLLLGEWTSTLHSKAAEAPVLSLPALCAAGVGRLVASRFGLRWARAFTAGCILWLAVIATNTGYDYFVRWGQAPKTRAAYFHTLGTITDHLNSTEYSGSVALSSPSPDLPLDPFIAELQLHREDLTLRWFDGRRAVVFPSEAHSLLIVPSNAPLHPYFTERLDLGVVEHIGLGANDAGPYFDVFKWDPNAAISSLMPPSGQRLAADGGSLRLPVNFGGAAELLSYELPTPTVYAGGSVTLVTFWRILDPAALGPVSADEYGPKAAIFVHMLETAGKVVGQADRLDAPVWNWHSGDAFAQLHRFQLDADLPAGVYRLEIGIYTHKNLTRLPVLVGGAVVDDHVLLSPIEATGG